MGCRVPRCRGVLRPVRPGAAKSTTSQVCLENLDVFRNSVGVGVHQRSVHQKSTRVHSAADPSGCTTARGDDAVVVTFRALAPWLGRLSKGNRRRAHVERVSAWAHRRSATWTTLVEQGRVGGRILRRRRVVSLGQRHYDGAASRTPTWTARALPRSGRIRQDLRPVRATQDELREEASTSVFSRLASRASKLSSQCSGRTSARRNAPRRSRILDHHLRYWNCGHRRGPTWKMHCPTASSPARNPAPGATRRPERFGIELSFIQPSLAACKLTALHPEGRGLTSRPSVCFTPARTTCGVSAVFTA